MVRNDPPQRVFRDSAKSLASYTAVVGIVWLVATFFSRWIPPCRVVVTIASWIFPGMLTITLGMIGAAIGAWIGAGKPRRQDVRRQCARDLFFLTYDLTGAQILAGYALSVYAFRQRWLATHLTYTAYLHVQLAAVDLSDARKAPPPCPPERRIVQAASRLHHLTRTDRPTDARRAELIELAHSIAADGPPTRASDAELLRIGVSLLEIAQATIDGIRVTPELTARVSAYLATASECLTDARALWSLLGTEIGEDRLAYDEFAARRQFPELPGWTPGMTVP
ncbi:hypothetical protein [Fodinicola acaciae]|uniref:hypothetical protein n=1 Tax=Fodinicola acaciae TaxID=2681555 RepID=UPI0013D7426B|nr:hypothetical protein [Fodinicola acaciae]